MNNYELDIEWFINQGGSEAYSMAFAEKVAFFIADSRLSPENARNKALGMYKRGDLEIDCRDTGIFIY